MSISLKIYNSFFCYLLISLSTLVSYAICQNAKSNIDLLFLIDDSKSMLKFDPEERRSEAINSCLKILKDDTINHRIGVIRFGNNVILSPALTQVDKLNSISLGKIKNGAYTSFTSAIDQAFQEFDAKNSFRGSYNPQIILITDGEIIGSTKELDSKQIRNLKDKELLKLLSDIGISIANLQERNCTLNIILINNDEKIESIWRNYAYQTKGLFYNIDEDPTIGKLIYVTNRILTSMLNRYQISLNLSKSDIDADSLIITAKIMRDTTVINDPNISLTAIIHCNVNKDTLFLTKNLNKGIYTKKFYRKPEIKNCILNITAIDRGNVLAAFSTEIKFNSFHVYFWMKYSIIFLILLLTLFAIRVIVIFRNNLIKFKKNISEFIYRKEQVRLKRPLNPDEKKKIDENLTFGKMISPEYRLKYLGFLTGMAIKNTLFIKSSIDFSRYDSKEIVRTGRDGIEFSISENEPDLDWKLKDDLIEHISENEPDSDKKLKEIEKKIKEGKRQIEKGQYKDGNESFLNGIKLLTTEVHEQEKNLVEMCTNVLNDIYDSWETEIKQENIFEPDERFKKKKERFEPIFKEACLNTDESANRKAIAKMVVRGIRNNRDCFYVDLAILLSFIENDFIEKIHEETRKDKSRIENEIIKDIRLIFYYIIEYLKEGIAEFDPRVECSVYEAFWDLLNINDDNLITVLSSVERKILAINRSDYVMGEMIYSYYSNIYFAFKDAIESDSPHINYLTKIKNYLHHNTEKNWEKIIS